MEEALSLAARHWRPASDIRGIAGHRRPRNCLREARRGFGKRVLLADDNADMRDYVARLLERTAMASKRSRDGEAALAAARAGRRRTSC